MRGKSMLGLGFEPKFPIRERDFKTATRPNVAANNPPLYRRDVRDDARQCTELATTLATTDYRLAHRPDVLGFLEALVLAPTRTTKVWP